MRNIILLLLLINVLQSCAVQKRHYLKGYSLQRNTHKQALAKSTNRFNADTALITNYSQDEYVSTESKTPVIERNKQHELISKYSIRNGNKSNIDTLIKSLLTTEDTTQQPVVLKDRNSYKALKISTWTAIVSATIALIFYAEDYSALLFFLIGIITGIMALVFFLLKRKNKKNNTPAQNKKLKKNAFVSVITSLSAFLLLWRSVQFPFSNSGSPFLFITIIASVCALILAIITKVKQNKFSPKYKEHDLKPYLIIFGTITAILAFILIMYLLITILLILFIW
jgi:hypothetical protein